MIPNTWYAILESKEVPRHKPVGVTRINEKLVLWRDKTGKVHCIFDQCCHRGASLSCGKLVHDKVQCPFHGFEYDPSGKVTSIPANGRKNPVPERFKVNAYNVKEAHGFIWLYNGTYQRDEKHLPAIPFFEELTKGFAYSSFSEPWPVHYTRAVENQLDVVHLPFVHESTIGKGNKTLVNGPVVEWEKDRMTFYVINETDKGQKPLKPGEIPDYKKHFHLQLQMPNTWQNIISDSVRIVAAFAPIDEHNTQIYLRFYHSFGTQPIVRQAIGFASKISNRIILHQDRRVVLTQVPDRTELVMNEKLIQGDLPIIEFRKKRATMKKDQPVKEETVKNKTVKEQTAEEVYP